MGSSSRTDDFSVVVLASDLGIDARPFLLKSQESEEHENWHDCPQYLADEDFSDLDLLQFFCLQGSDKSGNRIFRIVGKYFPDVFFHMGWKLLIDCLDEFVRGDWFCGFNSMEDADALRELLADRYSGERLKKYIFHKMCSELPEGPFCIVYMHSTVQKEDNSPGITILRWIYEDLPSDIKDRLQVVYFIHPGLRSRLVIATLGRFLLSGRLYWKIRYVSRLQYLWDDVKKREVEIPEFVQNHDDILEHRPLTDYGIEPDPFHLTEVPSTSFAPGSYEGRWVSREFVS